MKHTALCSVLATASALMMLAAGSAWAGQLDDIKAADAISFGTEGNYAPYTYHDEKGTLTGLTLKWVAKSPRNWALRPNSVKPSGTA